MSRLEDAIYDCESIIHDITKYRNTQMTLTTTRRNQGNCKNKVKELGACYDEMEREHRGYGKVFYINPLNMKKPEEKLTRICSIHFMKELKRTLKWSHH